MKCRITANLMPIIAVRVEEELKKKMDELKGVDWNEVTRRAIEEEVREVREVREVWRCDRVRTFACSKRRPPKPIASDEKWTVGTALLKSGGGVHISAPIVAARKTFFQAIAAAERRLCGSKTSDNIRP